MPTVGQVPMFALATGRGRALRLVLAHQNLRDRMAPAAAARLHRFFAHQAAIAAARFRASKASADTWVPRLPGTERKPRPSAEAIIPRSDAEVLIRVLLPHEQEVMLRSSALTAQAIGGLALNEGSEQLARMLGQAGTRIRHINDATRSAVRRTLEEGFMEELTDAQIGERLEAVVRETYTGRSQTIARTEMALSDNAAAMERYAARRITHVRVYDGPECGWETHDDPDMANGSVRTIADANSHQLAHPNCRRGFAPEVLIE